MNKHGYQLRLVDAVSDDMGLLKYFVT